ncbi:MAG: copper chaperone PCu(A)C [Steroidobacteraceae bacterium]
MPRRLRTGLLLLALVAPIATALTAEAGLRVDHAWLRNAGPGGRIAVIYLQLHNTSRKPIVVTAVEVPIATSAQIHRSSVVGGMTRMRPEPRVVVPAGRSVQFAPGGLHIMLMGLSRPLRDGERIPLRLLTESNGTIHAVALVRPLSAQ